MINHYSELMQRINEQTAKQLNCLQYSFVRLIVNFSGDCTVEYGYSDHCIVKTQIVPYSLVSILSKQLAHAPKTSETVQTTIAGLIVTYQLIISPKNEFCPN